MDFLTALVGGATGGFAADWVLRKRGHLPTETTSWQPDDALVASIGQAVRRVTPDPVKQRLLSRKLLLGARLTDQRRQTRARRRS